MIFYMDIPSFLDIFLLQEPGHIVLDANYMIVSCRITRSYRKNTINCNDLLLPKSYYYADTAASYKKAYLNDIQEHAMLFLAHTVKLCLRKDHPTMIFLCSKSEMKTGYLKFLGQFIMSTFHYPVYNYKEFAKGQCPVYEVDEKEVSKITDRILCRELLKLTGSTFRVRQCLDILADMDKKFLKKYAKLLCLDVSGMTRKEILEEIEERLTKLKH